MNNDGNKLTVVFFKKHGFVKEIFKDNDGDEVKWWIKDSISIYENSWWIKDGVSIYKEGETEPEITFSFATSIKGDGRFKGGFVMSTDTQVKNLYYSLANKELKEI